MKLLCPFISIIILFINQSIAQIDSGIPMSTAEKFNERGYSSSSSSNLDGNEIIGDYDGNLSMLYKTYYDLPNGLDYELTTTFNANISHNAFWIHSSSRQSGYSINKPGWIIGIKGIALQTTNFEDRYYFDAHNGLLQSGTATPTLIPGYHFTNRITGFNPADESEPLSDYINILKDDGSILSLYNTSPSVKTGLYIDTSPDGLGYSNVSLKPDNQYLRRMWYKPGDGLTYYFEEEMVKYSGRDFNADGAFINPRVMYLKSIISPDADTLFVHYYAWDNSSNPNYPSHYNPLGYGRKLVSGIYTNRRVHNADLSVIYFRLTEFYYNIENVLGTNILTDITLRHFYNGISKTQLMFSWSAGSSLFSADYSQTSTATKTRYVTGIIDEIDRYNTITYNAYYRKYRNGTGNFYIEISSFLPKKINYYNGKQTQFSYRVPSIEWYDFLFVGPGGCNSGNYSNIQTLNATFRDDHSNFMVSKKEIFDSYPALHKKIEENYNYLWENGGGSYNQCETKYNIKTIVTKSDYSSSVSSPSNITTIKNFTKYLVNANYYPRTFLNYGASVIRLASEMTQDGNKTIKKINTWGGDMFRLNSTEEIISDGIVSSRTTNFSYETIGAICTGKSLLTKTTMTDPQQLKKETGLYNYLPINYYDTSAFYKLSLTSFETVYNGLQKKSENIFTYIQSGENLGKLSSITKNNQGRNQILTNNYYIKSEDSVYYGLIKSLNKDNGLTYKFYYPRFKQYWWDVLKYIIVADTIQGYLLTTDGQKTLKNFIAKNFSTKPFRTEILFNNNADTLKTWTSYNTLGNLLFEVDVNGIYSEYNYDYGGRISRVKYPGSFFPSGQIVNDTTYLIQNYGVYANRQFTINGDGNINQFRYTRYEVNGAAPDGPEAKNINKDAEIEIDGYDGGGGGGGTPPLNPNHDFYLFFPDTIALTNITELYFANLNLETTYHNVSDGQDLTFKLYGITQVWSNGVNSYQTIGQKTLNFEDSTLMTINVMDIVQACINAGKNLYGFKISAHTQESIHDMHKEFGFSYSSAPLFSASFKIFNYEQSNARSSIMYTYDDVNNKLDVIKRFSSNPQDENKVHSQLFYDSFGKLRETKIKNLSEIFETKSKINVDYLGLTADEKDGEDRYMFFSYDGFQRVDTIFFEGRGQNFKKQIFEYAAYNDQPNHYQLKTIKDGENKTTKIYYLKNNLVDREEKINGDSILTTLYNYDDLYRLTSVVSPMGKITSYQYDDHSNISQKTSPDEGTTKYKYDKYGNLRFSINTGSATNLTFNKYDNFKRLILTGEKTFTNPWNDLDPDLDYSTNQGSIWAFENYSTNQGNFVLVNMYDKYLRTGVFANLPASLSGSLTNIKGKLVATAFRDKNTNTWSYKVYSYDYLGRVKDEYVFFQSTSSYKKITNEYDNLGNIVKQNVADQFYYWYGYDEQGRLKEVRSNMHNAYTTAKLEVIYTYDLSDKVTKTDFKSVGRMLYQTYVYDTKGRLDDLYGYRSTGTPEILFREDLGYFNNDNVSSINLTNKGNTTWQNLIFNYSYDDLNRLTSADCNNNTYDETYTYSNDGNLLTKLRPYNSSQSLTYDYTPPPGQPVKNQLNTLTKGSTNYTFTYDYKGNMITDSRKSITTPISYDRRNLPVSITRSGVNYTYNYDDAGQRIYKQTSTSNKELYLRDHTGKELAVYDWVTGKLKMLNLYGNGIIGKVNVYYNAQGVRTDNRQYYFKDHLGSIRQTFDATASIVGAQDYYPYGEILRSYYTGGNLNDKYKFTEKERDTETNYDYFGARYYDSDLGRWLQVDPLKDIYPDLSPYVYTANNPLKYVDPTGMSYEDLEGEGDRVLGRSRNYTLHGDDKKKKSESNTIGIALVGTAQAAISASSFIFGGLLGFVTIGLTGDTDPRQKEYILQSSASDIMDKIMEQVEGPIYAHLNKLAGNGNPDDGDPNDPWNQNKWKKDIQRALDKIKDKLDHLKIKNNTFKDVLNKRAPEIADKLLKELENLKLNIPK